jgi:hypothetical protein
MQTRLSIGRCVRKCLQPSFHTDSPSNYPYLFWRKNFAFVSTKALDPASNLSNYVQNLNYYVSQEYGLALGGRWMVALVRSRE